MNKNFCPICGGHEFIEFNGRPSARCKSCQAVERTRLHYIALQRLGLFNRNNSVLHFAPERSVCLALNELLDDYSIADLDTGKLPVFVENRLEINLCTFNPESIGRKFDYILHNHVLEHLPCDVSSVLRRLSSLLKPGGSMIFSFPISRNNRTVEDYETELTEEQRHTMFGQHNHTRYFGELDVVDILQNALGENLNVIDYSKCVSDKEAKKIGVTKDINKLSGLSLFQYKKPHMPSLALASA